MDFRNWFNFGRTEREPRQTERGGNRQTLETGEGARSRVRPSRRSHAPRRTGSNRPRRRSGPAGQAKGRSSSSGIRALRAARAARKPRTRSGSQARATRGSRGRTGRTARSAQSGRPGGR